MKFCLPYYLQCESLPGIKPRLSAGSQILNSSKFAKSQDFKVPKRRFSLFKILHRCSLPSDNSKQEEDNTTKASFSSSFRVRKSNAPIHKFSHIFSNKNSLVEKEYKDDSISKEIDIFSMEPRKKSKTVYSKNLPILGDTDITCVKDYYSPKAKRIYKKTQSRYHKLKESELPNIDSYYAVKKGNPNISCMILKKNL